MKAIDVVLPDEDDLVAELKAVRKAGISRINSLQLPALERLARASGRVAVDDHIGSFVIEAMIRDAMVQVGGDLADQGAISLGLEDGSRADRPPELRKAAAAAAGVGTEQFRHVYEPRILAGVSQIMLRSAHEHRLRNLQLKEEARTPVGSRLAVEWLARFEGMYQVWSPMTGVGNDLTACRSTLLEEDRPWDREPDPNKPGDQGHTQELQAMHYAGYGLYHFARLLAAERRFVQQFGGMWLMPDVQAETDIGDALYRVKLESPFTEHADSRLRIILGQGHDEELAPFMREVEEGAGKPLLETWIKWALSCKCVWESGADEGREFFPTHRRHAGIDRSCDVHNLIAASSDFCLILDDGWDQIADWYRDFPRPTRTGLKAEALYDERESPLPRWMVDESAL